VGGFDILQIFMKIRLIHAVSYCNLEGLGALFGGVNPTNACSWATGRVETSLSYTVIIDIRIKK